MASKLLGGSAVLGAAAYCLAILASKDAPTLLVAAVGAASLGMACASLGLLWREPRSSDDNDQASLFR